MTLDLAKLRAETLALIDGTTPGPWWTDGKYNGRDMGCAIIAARTDAGPLPGNPTRGMVAFSSAITNTQARGCEANARLIAAAPTLAADNLRLLDEIERLRDALRNTAEMSTRAEAEDFVPGEFPDDEFNRGFDAAICVARAALPEGGPDAR